MKSNAVIAYKGELTFKVLHGDKVVKTFKQHNEGTVFLMEFLTKCLGSQYESKDAPKFIRAFYTTSQGMSNLTECTLRPIVTNFAPSYKDDYVDEEDIPITKRGVVLTFLIPSNAIDIAHTTINRVAIYGTDKITNQYMAWIATEDITIVSGESLMILWEMTLENVEIQ